MKFKTGEDYVAVAWSVENLPSNLTLPTSIPGKVRDFSICVLSYVVFGGGPDLLLITHSGILALVYLSSVLVHILCSPYRHLIHWHLGCKSWRV